MVLCPALLAHCGKASEQAIETGNVVGVSKQKLHLIPGDTDVEVVGDAGAVGAGANVTVINRSSGEHSEAIAKVDGSFAIVVAGSLQDEYEVTVSNGSTTQMVRISASTNGPSSDTSTDLSSASCASLETTLTQHVSAGFAAGDKRCDADVDCVYADWRVGCYSGCGGTFLSVAAAYPLVTDAGAGGATGVEVTRATVEQDITPVCNELSSRCGSEAPSSCPPAPDPFEGECYARACRPANIDRLTCSELSLKAWDHASGLVDRAPRDCTVDADCALVSNSVRCVAGCGGSFQTVQVGAVEAAEASVRRAEDYFCSRFENKPCPPPTPLPCGAGGGPDQTIRLRCVAGLCQVTSQLTQ
jgi:hypothetical protein